MTPHPVWFYTLVNAEEHGLGVRDRRRDDGGVRRGTDDRLRDALNELGRVQRQLVVREADEKAPASAGASPRKVSKTTVTFSPVHMRCVALPVDVTVTLPTTPITSSASSSEEPMNVRDAALAS